MNPTMFANYPPMPATSAPSGYTALPPPPPVKLARKSKPVLGFARTEMK